MRFDIDSPDVVETPAVIVGCCGLRGNDFPRAGACSLPLPILAGKYPRNAPLDAAPRRQWFGARETASLKQTRFLGA